MNSEELIQQVRTCMAMVACAGLQGEEKAAAMAVVDDFIADEVSGWTHAQVLDRLATPRDYMEALFSYMTSSRPDTVCPLPDGLNEAIVDCRMLGL